METNTMTTTQPLFSTLKQIESSFHSSVGKHLVSTWSTYSLMRVEWPNGKVTIHLNRADYVNGQIQWGGSSYGVTDTQRIAADVGLSI